MTKVSEVPVWKHLSRYTQGVILIMVSVLFFGWGIRGQAQVQSQTNAILDGVQQALELSHEHLEATEDELLAQTRYLTCVIRLDPDQRNPKHVHRCEAKAGLL